MKVDVLPLETVRNPRDLGSYTGFEGRKIKKGRLIRSGKIFNLSEHDKKFLVDYGLNTIIDLRSPRECQAFPDDEIPGVKHVSLPLSSKDNTHGGSQNIKLTFEKYREDQHAGFRMMCNRYYHHVTSAQAQDTIHKILEILVNNPNGATLFHCSEGKDRTGLVAVIILYILGVDLETIRNDYLFSNHMLENYRAARDQKFAADGENLKFRSNMRVLGSVSDSFLDTALIAIAEEYGNLDNFIRSQLKVSDEMKAKLRDLYLEKN